MKFHEHLHRSITKAVTFRLLIILADSVLLYYFTRRLDLIVGILTISTLLHTLIYLVHERWWNQVHWDKMGKKS